MRSLLVLVLLAAPAAANDLASLGATTAACDPARATCIGLRLHVQVNEAGPIATADWVARQVTTANTHFAPIDVAFEIVGIEPLPASYERVEDKEERHSLAPLVKGKVIDVFITGHLDDIDKPGEMAFGVTWHARDRKFVILSTQAWERTLAHELGHVFGLPHSKYPISIMNKTKREKPPVEERTFHEAELKKMKARVRELVRGKVLANLKARPTSRGAK
jgi:hypothetical protein